MSENGKSGGFARTILVLSLLVSVGANYLQYSGKLIKPIAPAAAKCSSVGYLREVAARFGFDAGSHREDCDLAGDLLLLANSRKAAPDHLLPDETIDEISQVISKDEARILKAEHEFVKSVSDKHVMILERSR